MSQAEIDDRELAALLAAHALIEIRYLASTADRSPAEVSPEEALRRIRFLADLAHNLPLAAGNRPADGTARWRRGRWAGHGRPAARRDRPGSAAVSSRPVARGHLRPRCPPPARTSRHPPSARHLPRWPDGRSEPHQAALHSPARHESSEQWTAKRSSRSARKPSGSASAPAARGCEHTSTRPGPTSCSPTRATPAGRTRCGAQVVGVHGAAADGRWRTAQEQPRRAATRSDPGTSQKRPASARIRFGGRPCTARR
jgi:hypothetical protein